MRRGFRTIVTIRGNAGAFVDLGGLQPSPDPIHALSRRRLTAHDGHRSLGQAGPATCLCFIEMRYGQHRVTLAAPLTNNA